MTHPHTPQASNALQKARELAEESLQQLKPHSPNWVCNVEKYIKAITAERDVALKGYRGLRGEMEKVYAHKRADFSKTATEEGLEMIAIARKALVSFPEIK